MERCESGRGASRILCPLYSLYTARQLEGSGQWGLNVNRGRRVINRESARSQFPLFWRALGALVLGVLLARWTWVLFAPQATAMAVSREPAVAAETGRLFGVAAAAPAQVETGALPNVQLIGVFAARAGKPSFAVLRLDGKQVGVAMGETVSGGAKLTEVHADYVLLERAGVQQRVSLEGRAAGSPGVIVAPAVR